MRIEVACQIIISKISTSREKGFALRSLKSIKKIILVGVYIPKYVYKS
jgi:hypothetical protein